MDLTAAVLRAREDLQHPELAIPQIAARAGVATDVVRGEWDRLVRLVGPPSIMDAVRAGLDRATDAADAIRDQVASGEMSARDSIAALREIGAERLKLLAMAEKALPSAEAPIPDDDRAIAEIRRMYGAAQ